MIYLWNGRQLARDLKNNTVTELHKCIYLILYPFATAAISTLVDTLLTISDKIGNISLHQNRQIKLIFSLWELILFIILTLKLYKVNEKGDGTRFVERYISLSFPVAFRMIIIGFILMFPYGFPAIGVFEALGATANMASIISAFVVLATSCLYFYVCIETMLKIASGQTDKADEHRTTAGL